MNQPQQRTDPEQYAYQTGSTCPPKNYRGVIAVLLVLVIFLGGIVSGLGLMNIHLFRKLQKQQESSFRFSQEESMSKNLHTDSAALGFVGEEIPSVHRSYYQLPQGLYITEVAHNSDAFFKGVLPGDILVELDGLPVIDASGLEALLTDRRAGDTVSALFYRKNTLYTLTLTLGR